MPLAGGYSETKHADADVRETAVKAKASTQTKLGKNYALFEAISYRSQIVNGTNYLIKVKTDNGYIHIKVYRSFKGEVELKSIQEGQTLGSEINIF